MKKLTMSEALRKNGGKFPGTTTRMFKIVDGKLHACALGAIYSAIFPMPAELGDDGPLYIRLSEYFFGDTKGPQLSLGELDDSKRYTPIQAVYTLNDSGFKWSWEQIATWLEERGL